MLLTPVAEIKEGQVLARPVFNPQNPRQDLLKVGFVLKSKIIKSLVRIGIDRVWVQDNDFDFLDDMIDDQLESAKREVFSDVQEHFSSIMDGKKKSIPFNQYEDKVKTLFDSLFSNQDSVNFLQELNTYDNFLSTHCFNVCYLSILLAIKLDHTIVREKGHAAGFNEIVCQIGEGALFHDIGKTVIDKKIALKPLGHTKEELEKLMPHVQEGFKMLRDHVDPSIANVALNHHQKHNGKGYPSINGGAPLAGKKIHIYSRVVNIVNVYDLLTTVNPYVPPKLPVQALYYIKYGLEGWFDPEIRKAFLQLTPPFPVGSRVRLNSGDFAVVVTQNVVHPCRPTIKLFANPKGERYPAFKQTNLDLATSPTVIIQFHNGVNVEKYLYSQ
ncbi:MAG: hypothetical protein COA79_19535 [Planctomycetota bacterium]|nr:MAG: hypothetical protein COA79_19535 [Planctomycetota bacterium]